MRNRCPRVLILALLMMAALLAGPANAQRAAVDTIGPAAMIRPAPEGRAFPHDTVLHYDAEWRIWKAGTASLRIDGAGTEERVSASADATGVVAMLYRVQDRFESYFDRHSFCSRSLTKQSEEGLHKRHTVIRFDQGRRKAILDERNLRTGESKHTEQDTPGCVTDVLSGMYYLASLPLEPGSASMFPLNDGGRTVNVQAVTEAREDIKTDAGTFRTVRVQLTADSGELKSRGKVWLWYSDDANHTLIQVRTRLFWGTLNIRLARVEHEPSQGQTP
jgi:hypothetical protein